MGNFAQQIHPLKDEVTLTIRRTNSRTIDVVKVRLAMSHSRPKYLCTWISDSIQIPFGLKREELHGYGNLARRELHRESTYQWRGPL